MYGDMGDQIGGWCEVLVLLLLFCMELRGILIVGALGIAILLSIIEGNMSRGIK